MNSQFSFNYPHIKLQNNAFFAKFSFLDIQYKVVLFLKDSDWKKPIVLGCDRFRDLITDINSKTLIQYLMQISNPNEAFFIIMKFINCYGLKYYSHSHSRAIVPNNNHNSLLDEIRRIGFNRIIDSNDNFSILKVKISSDHIITITMNPSLQFHFDLFPKILPFNCSFDKSEEGFLLKLIKLAESELNLLLKAQLIFKQIDESFSTLEPERFDQFLFERRIHVAHQTIVLVSYDSVKKVLHLNITDLKSESVDHPLIDIQNNNEEEFIIKTISQFLSTCKTQDSDDIKAECGICYSDYLDGKVAEFPCTHCKQIYHENCLKEWFMTNPDCRTIFNQICGSCLFCEKDIYLKI